MEPNIHFKFKGFNNNDSDIDLENLGSSLIGFDQLIKTLIKATNLKGEISLRATTYRDGSIVIDALLEVKNAIEQLPFETLDSLLEYLNIASDSAYREAMAYFQEINSTRKSLNDYFSKYPFDLALLVGAVQFLIQQAKKHKNERDLVDTPLPKRIAHKLHNLIKKSAFKKAIKPIVDDKFSSIEISSDRDFKHSAKIDQNNFQNYLALEDQILSYMENGSAYELFGDITSMKSTRGDSLTFKHVSNKKTYYLDLLPPDGETTKSYTEYYKERVCVRAEIVRTSLYKKPKLKLQAIDLQQKILCPI